MKFWTHPYYHNNKLGKLFQSVDDKLLEVKHGNFLIKYTGYDNSSYFGIFSWKGCICKNTHVEFYEGDKLLFTKKIIRPREFHFIIGGDGVTKENTFYLWHGKNEKGYSCVKVNDFNDEHIKDTFLGPDCYTGLMPVSDNYFVVITEEMCTFARFFGLVNKEQFFIKKKQENNQAYDQSRIGIFIDWHEDMLEYMEPIEATDKGLIFANIKFSDDYKEKIYTKIELVLYSDVATYDQEKN